MSLFRYVIFPDRVYTLEYKEGYRFEVKGQAILDMFEDKARLNALFFDQE